METKKKDKSGIKGIRRFFYGAIVTLLPCITVFLLGPLEIYNSNKDEFFFGILNFLPIFVLGTAICCLMGGMVSLIPKVGTFYIDLVFCLGICMYVQVMFMNGHLREADGTRIIWREKIGTVLTNALIWIAVIALICFIILRAFKKFKYKVILGAVLYLVVVQTVAIISIIATNGLRSADNRTYALNTEDILEVGKEDNIIVFVVDMWSAWDFENNLKVDPGIETDLFKDFVYYDNANSQYNTTFPSLIHMLTGAKPDYGVSPIEWKNNSWQSDLCRDFYKNLHEAGYCCELYSLNDMAILGDLKYAEGLFDNLSENPVRVSKLMLTQAMLKMSLYRVSPYLIKDFFEQFSDPFSRCVIIENDNVVFENYDFYERMKSDGGLKLSDKDREFKFIHICGVHPPYHSDAGCNKVNDASRAETSMGIDVLLAEYLDMIKELGVYDKSTIIITADHGADRYITDENCYQPVFLFKPKDTSNVIMTIDPSPISHDDLLSTILESAGIDHNGFGTSITEWKVSDQRERIQSGYSYVGDRNDLQRNIDEKKGIIDENAPSEWQ